MRFLLDTHALLFWFSERERLSSRASEVMADRDHEILVSSASIWEITTKHRIGKLPSAGPLVVGLLRHIENAGFAELPITFVHAERAGGLTHPHRDPFDRVIAAQSLIEAAPVVTLDGAIASLGAQTVW